MVPFRKGKRIIVSTCPVASLPPSSCFWTHPHGPVFLQYIWASHLPMNAEDFISWNTDSSEFLSWHNIYAMQSCVFSKKVYSGVSHKEASTAFMEIICQAVGQANLYCCYYVLQNVFQNGCTVPLAYTFIDHSCFFPCLYLLPI